MWSSQWNQGTVAVLYLWLAMFFGGAALEHQNSMMAMGFSSTPPLSLHRRLHRQRHRQQLVAPLRMGKGRNKQQDLARKMEMAKRQKREREGKQQEKGESDKGLTAGEIKERNDRLRFQQLLEQSAGKVLNNYAADGYLTQEQEERDNEERLRGVDQLFEDDPAPTDCFQELVSVKSDNVIGETGASRLIPWLRKNPDRRSDYLIILTDPRKESPELRQTIKRLANELPEDILDRMIVVNADTPAQNRRWMKKNKAYKIDIYSDEKLEWLQTYSALGKDRWTMFLYVIANERVVRLVRGMDGFEALRVVTNAVQDFR